MLDKKNNLERNIIIIIFFYKFDFKFLTRKNTFNKIYIETIYIEWLIKNYNINNRIVLKQSK